MTLEIRGVTKRLGGRTILDGVSLACAPSETVVIVGENGAGKSTLLRIVAGLVEPDRGEVRIGGSLVNDGGLEARRALGYVPDATDALPDLLVDELLTLVGALKGAPVGRRGAKDDPLADLRAKLGLDAIGGRRLATLSFGERKRVCVLAALIGAPWLLVLDEPSNGLDPGGVALVRALIESRRADGQGTLLATNDRAFVAAIGGSLYTLKDARLARAL
jgi:ABC-type multidrug transport system ATPase subunit